MEHPGDVGHEVDRVVPHDRHPRLVQPGDEVLVQAGLGARGLDRGGGHGPSLDSAALGAGTSGAAPARAYAPAVGNATNSSTALLTDHYELTMLQAALQSGTAQRRCVFEVFARRLPEGRRYGVVAGTGRLLDALEGFRFGPAELELLERAGLDRATRDAVADYRFSGDIWGYGEGETYVPGSPLLVVEGTFAEAVLLETLILSILNFDSAVAAAASRMTCASSGRPCIEMGSRRAHEQAAVAAARAAYISGFATTSNLEASRRYGVPSAGTSAHAFTLLHDDEEAAFRAQVAALGPGTTLLVDTYDVMRGVRRAVAAAGPSLGAVRLDSGDLITQAKEVRELLDSLGAAQTRILVTSDLDEYALAAMAAAPVDGYGVGTSLVTGSGAPTAGLVYKLTARARSLDDGAPLEPVAKASAGKPSRGGRKWAARRYDESGVARQEAIGLGSDVPAGEPGRPLLRHLVRKGEVIGREPLEAARSRHGESLGELPPHARQLSKGEAALETVYV
nr:nicotinate phosphoribosyltransferase [Motilibacter aurantiacus]